MKLVAVRSQLDLIAATLVLVSVTAALVAAGAATVLPYAVLLLPAGVLLRSLDLDLHASGTWARLGLLIMAGAFALIAGRVAGAGALASLPILLGIVAAAAVLVLHRSPASLIRPEDAALALFTAATGLADAQQQEVREGERAEAGADRVASPSSSFLITTASVRSSSWLSGIVPATVMRAAQSSVIVDVPLSGSPSSSTTFPPGGSPATARRRAEAARGLGEPTLLVQRNAPRK